MARDIKGKQVITAPDLSNRATIHLPGANTTAESKEGITTETRNSGAMMAGVIFLGFLLLTSANR